MRCEKLLLNHFSDAQAFLAPTPVSPSVGYTECSNLVRGLDDKEVDKVDDMVVDEVADMAVPTDLRIFSALRVYCLNKFLEPHQSTVYEKSPKKDLNLFHPFLKLTGRQPARFL